jgi:hypothetical protein
VWRGRNKAAVLSISPWHAGSPDGVYWPWRASLRWGRFFLLSKEPVMSRETPKDAPRQRADKPSITQTDEPWKATRKRSSTLQLRTTLRNGSAAKRIEGRAI